MAGFDWVAVQSLTLIGVEYVHYIQYVHFRVAFPQVSLHTLRALADKASYTAAFILICPLCEPSAIVPYLIECLVTRQGCYNGLSCLRRWYLFPIPYSLFPIRYLSSLKNVLLAAYPPSLATFPLHPLNFTNPEYYLTPLLRLRESDYR